jgi:hypothetical protein
MHEILIYSDLVGGIAGIVGSIILGYPLVTEITDRLHWDLLREFKERQAHLLTVEEIEAHRRLRDRLIDDRLGEHDRYRRITVWGLSFLLVAFLFMTVASWERAFPLTAPSTARVSPAVSD